MECKATKRILHAKDSQAKLAFFHNEIISRLANGEKVTVVNMPEFDFIEDTRITSKKIDEIAAIQSDRMAEQFRINGEASLEQIVFIFDAMPSANLLSALKKLDSKEINVAIVDFSAIYAELFKQIGFDVLYINDNYLDENPVYGSVEELNAALLRTIT